MPSVIALDAMGSDRAPKPEIEGAIQAARHHGVRTLLVGSEPELRAELNRYHAAAGLPIEIVHASEVITMDDKAVQAVRSKRDSSIHVGVRLVREGRAAGFVTAGNTGAAMATAKMVLGGIPGVDRPALAAVFPPRSAQSPSFSTWARTSTASLRTWNSSRLWVKSISAACLVRGVRGWACSRLAKKKPRGMN